MRRLLSVLALAIALQAMPVSGAPVDGKHDFDFQIGSWKVHVLRLKHPLSGAKGWVAYDGTHVVSKVWRGQANLGVLEIGGAAGHIEGQSLRLYDPAAHQWSFTFARSGAGTLGRPMVGAFKNGRGEFFNQETYDGRAVFVRSVTSNITRNSYRDEYAYSADGGKTWETNWIATYTRANVSGAADYEPRLPRDSQQRAFDFELGTWNMHLRRLMHPLTGSTTWVTYDGPSVVWKIWGGRSNLGEIDIAGPAGRIVGLSLRLYNPQAHQWNISFASASGGTLGVPSTVGAFENGRGEFFDQEVLGDGRTIYNRFVFSNITRRSYHFEQAFSDDGGRSWEVNWIADFTRA